MSKRQVTYTGPSSNRRSLFGIVAIAAVGLVSFAAVKLLHRTQPPAPYIEVSAAPAAPRLEESQRITDQEHYGTPVKHRVPACASDDECLRAVLAAPSDSWDQFFGFDAGTMDRAERAAKRWRLEGR